MNFHDGRDNLRVRYGRHLDRSGSQQSVRLLRSSKRSLLLVGESESGSLVEAASSATNQK
jgi:hypothetical protein